MTVPAISRRARWIIPAGAVAAVGAVAAASAITVAQAAPALPRRTPAQLLAGLARSTTPPPLTGTVVETASLGIPQLPDVGGPTSLSSLLAGSHTLRVWYGGPEHVRLAVPVRMEETDFIRSGHTAWLWQSSTNSVTKILIPRERGHAAAPVPSGLPVTPAQAARQVLAAVGPTTKVTTETNVTVAGQAAYQLVIAPRDHRSLIGKVTIALDGAHLAVPLRVQIFARGARSPAFQVGFTSVSFVRPAAANFAFTPPRGAQVHIVKPAPPGPAMLPLPGARARLLPGAHMKFTALPPPLVRRILRLHHAHIVRVGNRVYLYGPKGKRVALRPGFPPGTGWYGAAGRPVPAPPGVFGQVRPAAPRVIGRAWLSVVEFPAAALSGLANGNAAFAAGQAARSVSGQGGSISNGAMAGAMLQAARPVHGAWGRGRLLRTSLVSVLITSTGHVFAGAVTPQVLYAAAAQGK